MENTDSDKKLVPPRKKEEVDEDSKKRSVRRERDLPIRAARKSISYKDSLRPKKENSVTVEEVMKTAAAKDSAMETTVVEKRDIEKSAAGKKRVKTSNDEKDESTKKKKKLSPQQIAKAAKKKSETKQRHNKKKAKKEAKTKAVVETKKKSPPNVLFPQFHFRTLMCTASGHNIHEWFKRMDQVGKPLPKKVMDTMAGLLEDNVFKASSWRKLAKQVFQIHYPDADLEKEMKKPTLFIDVPEEVEATAPKEVEATASEKASDSIGPSEDVASLLLNLHNEKCRESETDTFGSTESEEDDGGRRKTVTWDI